MDARFGIDGDVLKSTSKKVPIRYGDYRFEICAEGLMYDNKIYNKIDIYSDRADDGITDRYYCILQSVNGNTLIQFNCSKDAEDFDTIVDSIIKHLNTM